VDAQLGAVYNAVSSQPPTLHVIFVPGSKKVAQKLAAMSAPTKKGVVIGPEDLKPLLLSPYADGRLRRMFLQQGDPTAVAPFIYAGSIDSDTNLFAGRAEKLDELIRLPRARICGGRRIGKTSLVHALCKRLAEEEQPWCVGYCDLQCFGTDQDNPDSVGHWDVSYVLKHRQSPASSEEDPDLRSAIAIATALNIPPPQSLDEFRLALLAHVQKTKTAILLDEVDCYIKASRWFHGDKRFPLMYSLRSVEQNSLGRMKVVLAGFKELYYESHRPDLPDHAYPFGQWLMPVNLGPLSFDEANDDLIGEGLATQMGFVLPAASRNHLFNLASGHPAFLQFFCSRVLVRNHSRLKEEGAPEITLEEIQRVYEERTETGDSNTFLTFVAETLGMNLDALERAIVLTLAMRLKDEKQQNQPVARHEVVTSLREYFEVLSIEAPSEEQIHWAFDNLVMVGMLTRHFPEQYAMSYTSYVDILSRLNCIEKRNLEAAIGDFDRMRNALR
jgi:hypothetical protein